MQPRLVSTFGRRKSRSFKPKTKALVESLLPQIEITERDTKLSLKQLSPTATTFILEIGFGAGEHLASRAAEHPECCYLGAEIYWDGIGRLVEKIDKRGLKNIRIFTDDARLLIAQLPDASLDGVYILHPDPWPKLRHQKRRLVQQPLFRELARVVKPGGWIRLATDHPDYAEWMLVQAAAAQDFTLDLIQVADRYTPFEGHAQTRYQSRGEMAGNPAQFLCLVRDVKG